MVDIIAQLIGVIGLDVVPPETLAEFFPYYFKVLLGFCCVAGLLQFFRWCVEGVTRGGRGL